jgi:superfamily II DNA or RNA helicase
MEEPTGVFSTRGFSLFHWQQEAVDCWVAGDGDGPFRGTLEVFTGGGKTLIALACAERVAHGEGGARLAVVVPTEALAHQWMEAILSFTNTDPSEVGLLGAGGQDELSRKRVLVAVLNTAARRLPEMVKAAAEETMLIVDECHRAGAPTFSHVLDTPARYRLGLSATPDREELDDQGEPLEYDEQLVGRSLGRVVFRFSLREARLAGWLPNFTVHHHGVQLLSEERPEYDRLSRQIDDLSDRIRGHGADASRARSLVAQRGDLGQLASAYVAATAKRKDLLYRARERTRVAERLLRDVLARRRDARVLMFHERIDEAIELRERLAVFTETGIEHSRIPASERRHTLDMFRAGSLNVLVSVKSLIEGIDVPSADVGVSVASSSSVRQRIQSLGRVLRRTFDETEKTAEMHVIYIADSVDEVIYTKEDWSDLTGDAANSYWRWPVDADSEPERAEGPPRTPLPTEEQEWERLSAIVPRSPQQWLGAQPEREYSVDTTGTVRNVSGALIANGQDVARMIQSVRGRPGGRFFVTPVHHLVVVREATPDGRLMVAGQLAEPFSTRVEVASDTQIDVSSLRAGDPYPGPLDTEYGEYRLSQKRGGVIQRDLAGGNREFALTNGVDPEHADNAGRVLAAWRSVANVGLKIALNSEWHAWYLEGGEPRFLAEVPGGFAWPSETRGGD